MRRCYLVCYDIRNPRRLRRIHKILRGYGEYWHFSVLFCLLRDIELVRLQSDLDEEMNLKEDQTMIVDLDPNEKRARETVRALGQPLPEQNNGTIIV